MKQNKIVCICILPEFRVLYFRFSHLSVILGKLTSSATYSYFLGTILKGDIF